MAIHRRFRYFTFQPRGFTIVEVAVVIVVIGILASITVVSYGNWQKRAAESAVKSDLNGAVAAMDDARNFSEVGYPVSMPSNFKASNDVLLSGGGSSDGEMFCIQGTSTKEPRVVFFVSDTLKSPQAGNCGGSAGLMGWWPMNGDANDFSGNDNDGAVYGATSTTGQNGSANGAYDFDGTTAYIDAGASTSLTFTDNFSLSTWIKPTGYHTTGYYGLMNGVLGRGPASTYNYALQVTNSTTITFIKRTGSESLQFYNFSGIPSLTNKWTLVTLTVKSGAANLYVNGTLFATRSVGAIAGATNDRLNIGSEVGGGGNKEGLFIGSIDDVRIYNRALSAADVQAVYVAGAQ